MAILAGFTVSGCRAARTTEVKSGLTAWVTVALISECDMMYEPTDAGRLLADQARTERGVEAVLSSQSIAGATRYRPNLSLESGSRSLLETSVGHTVRNLSGSSSRL